MIDNDFAEILLNAKSDAEASDLASKRIGIAVQVIRNNKKAIPLDKLKKGDGLLLFNGNKYYHTEYYMGDGKYSDCSSGHGVQAGDTLSSTAKSHIKVAIRPKG